jgi:hypothetical protein
MLLFHPIELLCLIKESSDCKASHEAQHGAHWAHDATHLMINGPVGFQA